MPGMQAWCCGVFAAWALVVALFIRFGHFSPAVSEDGGGPEARVADLDVSDVVTLPIGVVRPASVKGTGKQSGGLGRQSRANTRTLDGQGGGGAMVCDRPRTPDGSSGRAADGRQDAGTGDRVRGDRVLGDRVLGDGYVFASGRFVELRELVVLHPIIPVGWLS